ncbi:lactococcin 972 family bacteriocin [Streptomyces caatingaensis]|uniref:lactococcin 972 family bacteriocin n=1 Tax=Streptomyces caatingaensis TaxID=1678637 RepID=UPI00099BF7D9|nr:lactococcin 972 family bacteriocin [Streptomyces caatingaensis]
MKLFGRSLVVVAASTAVAAGVLVSPASGATPRPPKELGNVTEWGMVEIKVDPNAKLAAPMASKNVGGGTWEYGTELTPGGKRCYSYYYHGSKLHNATVEIGGGSLKVGAKAGETARASKTAGAAYTCHAYWGVTG